MGIEQDNCRVRISANNSEHIVESVHLWKESQTCEHGDTICVDLIFFFLCVRENVGRDSSVGIATRFMLDDPGIESRWGVRFSTPCETGRDAHSSSCAMGLLPGV